MKKRKVKIDALTCTKPQLNWLIAEILGYTTEPLKLGEMETTRVVLSDFGFTFDFARGLPFNPIEDWTFGGPLFSGEGIAAVPRLEPDRRISGWSAYSPRASGLYFAETELLARARCFVGSFLGREFAHDLPEILCSS